MSYITIDTPALLIDKKIMKSNLVKMQDYANSSGVRLRPHSKTHKTAYLAKLQVEQGAIGIAVAKVSEAEVMAKAGIKDIFIANEIVSEIKLNKIKEISKYARVTFGVDSVEQCQIISKVFKDSNIPAEVLIEIEVGEVRSGVANIDKFKAILNYIKGNCNIKLKGVFSHDGNSYSAKDLAEAKNIHITSQQKTLQYANIAEDLGFSLETISVGSTPSMIKGLEILKGITEIRPGTYIFMDAAQAKILDGYDRCAASVLATVISKPTEARIVLDVGAKGLTMQSRTKGWTKTTGFGVIKKYPHITIDRLFDEHAVINNLELSNKVKIGDRLEIIPNHICPVVNLYDSLYLIEDDNTYKKLEISARGKIN